VTFEKVRKNSTGRKSRGKYTGKKSTGIFIKKKYQKNYEKVREFFFKKVNIHSKVTRRASPGRVGCAHARSEEPKNEFI
jgi:hypothetical protein